MKRLLPLLLAATFSAAVASPTSPVVVAGQATFNQQGNVFTITNTPNTIINWQSFSVAPGEVTRFVQQSASSAVLNRILGQDPTQILGALQSNGQVFLINPNGVMFGKDARIDVAGLTASTLNLSDADFLAGRRKFAAGPAAGNISNQGAISAQPGGHVFLVAPNVENTGIITAPNGDVVLAAGRQVQLVDSRDPDMHVVVSAPEDKAVNLGQVISQGGRIGIYGALVRQRGEVNANSAVVGQNGKIVLKASGDTMLEEGSKTTATGAGNGGAVHVLGNRVAMTGNATVDVSGGANGGTVLMGGDYKGSNPLYASAQQTWLGKDASIKADAGNAGKGGKVILWATDATRAFGSISARGGAASGDGGFIETSADYLDVNGLRVSTLAQHGKNGVWLLDPLNITVGLPNCSGGDTCFSAADARVFANVPEVTGLISVATLLSAGSDIVLQAKNNIRFNDAITTGATSITANAGNSIYVDAPLTTTGGAIRLIANDPMSGTSSGNGGVYVNNHLRSNGGEISLVGKEVTLASTGSIDSGAANVNFNADRLSLGSYVNAGAVSGSNLVTIMPYTRGRGIVMGNTPSSNLGVLYLTNNELGNLHASQIRIGDAIETGDITWDWPGIYSSASTRTLSLRTSGLIKVNNLIELQDPASHIDLHSGSLEVTGSGSVKANQVTLRADAMHIGGAVKGAEQVKVFADTSSHIAVGDGVEGSLTLQNAELALLSGAKVQIGDAGDSGGVTVGTLNYAPGTANHLTIESGSGSMAVEGGVTTNGSLSLNAALLNIGGTGSVTAPNVTLRADQIEIGGHVNAASSIKLLPKFGTQMIAVGGLPIGIDGALTIDATEMTKLASPNLYIGDSAQAGSVHLGALSYSGNLTVDAGTAHLDVDGAVVATGSLALESDHDLAINSTGSVEAANVTLRADHMAIGGSVKGASAIKVMAGSTSQHIELGGVPVTTEYSLKLDNTELAQFVSPDLYIGDVSSTGGVNIDNMSYVHTGAGKLTVDAGMTNIHFDGWATTNGALVLKATTGIHQAVPATSTNNVITTPHLHLEGNGTEGVSVGLTNDTNMIGKLTGSNLRDLHLVNGRDLTIGDGTTGLQYRSSADYNGLEIALANNSKLTVQDSIVLHKGHIDIEAGSVQVGLPLDSAGNSAGTSSVLMQSHSMNIEASGPDGVSLSKGSLVSVDYTDITTDKFQLEQGAAIVSPDVSGHVGINPYSNGVRIELGSGAVDNSTTGLVTLGLSEAELRAIDTHHISIGDYVEGEPGLVSVIGSLDLSAAPRLESINIFLGAAGMDIRSGASLIGTRSVNIESVYPSTRAGDVIVNGLLEARKTETMSDQTVHSVGNVWIEATAVRGTGLIKSGFVMLDTTNGIGTASVPLDLQVFGLWAQNTQYGAVGAPINLRNNYSAGTPNHLMVAGLHQFGDGVGSISLETWGGMTIADQNGSYTAPEGVTTASTSTTPEVTVQTKTGAISLVTHSPLNVEGIVQSTSGAISLKAADGGTLTVTSTGKLQSTSGNITLEATTLNIPAGSVSTGGTVTLTGTVNPTSPTLSDCLAAPSTAGCAPVLNAALDACIADKTGSYCAQVLPTMTMCIADETKKGCSVVLPTLEQCLANRTAEGCSVVLPTSAECAATPSLPGCVTSGPTLEQCIANPSISGCSSVLPPLSVCIANKATAGCEAVLPDLTECIADKTLGGCEVVLPNLAVCIADKTVAGCGVVLPTLEACIANKATAGCEVVLPSLAVCIANKATPGCQVVLPDLLACIADKTAPGCDTVLPNMAACIADKTTPGCEVILPNLTACIADKTAPGCEVVLPNLATCIANKATAGCEVVLPAIAVCVADKSTAGCEVVLPNLAACIADKTTAGCEVVLPKLAACIADKTTAGCEVVLPNLAACIANKSTAGCEVVLPTLAACIVNKTSAGCEVVLPNLAACVADKTTPGCEVVLPTMAACIANKATAGCEAVLPPLSVCVANSSTIGCEVVLPSIAQCVVNPTLGGCDVVLPTLAQCIANKSTPGCEVILPTMAECIGSPSLGGCSVILPKLEQCAVNPNLEGCVAVLPKPDFCTTHPTDPTCQIFSPGSGQQGGQEKAPVTEAVQTSVTLVSKTPQPQPGAPSSSTSTGTGSGTAQSQGQQQEPEKQAEKEQGTAAADNTGVKNEKPATKTYCN